MKSIKDKMKVVGQRNNTISVRLNGETEIALERGLKQTGLSRASYVRLAIIEKSKVDSMNK